MDIPETLQPAYRLLGHAVHEAVLSGQYPCYRLVTGLVVVRVSIIEWTALALCLGSSRESGVPMLTVRDITVIGWETLA